MSEAAETKQAPGEVVYTCPGCGRALTAYVLLAAVPTCTRCGKKMTVAPDGAMPGQMLLFVGRAQKQDRRK